MKNLMLLRKTNLKIANIELFPSALGIDRQLRYSIYFQPRTVTLKKKTFVKYVVHDHQNLF